MEGWLTIAEVAARLRVSKMTVYRLVKSGGLPAVRVGRSVRVDAAELDKFLEGGRVSAGSGD